MSTASIRPRPNARRTTSDKVSSPSSVIARTQPLQTKLSCRGRNASWSRVGSITKCEFPTFPKDCTSEAPLGPDLPPARPRPATHPLPPRRGPHPRGRDRRPARATPRHHLPRAGPEPLPRRRPRLLRLLPPERPGPGAATPAAASEARHRPRPAGARGRAAQGRLVAAADRWQAQAGSGRRDGRLPRDHLPPRLRPGGPRGGPLPPPAQGAPPTWEPPRPPAPEHADPARALDREPAGGGQRPGGLRALGGRPADLPQGARQGERDLAGGAEEPLHLPAAQRRQALGGGRRRHHRRPPGATRGGPPDRHLRPRQRVRRLRRPRPRPRGEGLLLRPARPLAEGWHREPERPGPPLPAAREPARGARATPPAPARRPAQRHAPALPRLPDAQGSVPAAPGGPDRAALTSPRTSRTSRRNRRSGQQEARVARPDKEG